MVVMDFRIFIEPQQGATYSAVAHLARRAEGLGFEGFFTSDHYLKMGESDGLPGPLDAWTTLAGLSRDTSTMRLGTLVTPVTFRHPLVLAIQVAQVDHMSDGRVELGLGAGWYEAEHLAHGIPFPPLGERFDRLEEALAVITDHWLTPGESTFDHPGPHYPIVGSPGLPKPAQEPRVPIIMGGGGQKRTPRLAASYADEFNLPFSSPESFVAQREVVRAACEANGRDPESMTFSVAQVVCIGADDESFERRADAILREPAELRTNGVAGLPDEARSRVGAFAELGVDRMYLQVLDLSDLTHLDLIAETLNLSAHGV